MATIYKEKLIDEINKMPDSMLPRFYRIVQTLRSEFMVTSTKEKRRGSLLGIWKDTTIEETLIKKAKKSLFKYENRDRKI
ncbi:MAG: hypothetical protein KKD69_01385 [Euryarchaeota archaeon]|nr:hypothetical protein [Euryarchaeota archaeon]